MFWCRNKQLTFALQRMLIETNPWLLGLTVFVSLLHTIFDFLAFKNGSQISNHIRVFLTLFLSVKILISGRTANQLKDFQCAQFF